MNSTITLNEWFNAEVLRRRTLRATAFSMLLVPIWTFFFCLVMSFSPSAPIIWLETNVYRLGTWDYWCNTLLLMLIILFFMRLNVHHYSVTTFVPNTRLLIIWRLVNPLRLLHYMLHIALSCLTASCLLSLLGGSLAGILKSSVNQEDKYILNEKHIFILWIGAVIGGVWTISFFLSNKYHLKFPIVLQKKIFRFKGAVPPLITHSCTKALKILIVLYPLHYFLIANVLNSAVKSSLWITSYTLDQSASSRSLSSLVGILDLSLLFCAWIVAAFIHFFLSLPMIVYTIYHTEPVIFPISSNAPFFADKTLHHAIACQNHPLLQYLAVLDLCLLSKFSRLRRKELFSLTSPGCHPLNWNNVIKECLLHLNTLISDISSRNEYAMISGSFPTGIPLQTFTGHERQDSTVRSAFPSTPDPAYGLTHRGSAFVANDDPFADRVSTSCRPSKGYTSKQPSSSLLNKALEMMKQHSAFTYLAGELTENTSRQLFSDAQKYTWIVEALSQLAHMSITEDQYGVVQKSLGDILTSLLSLLDATSRHIQLSPVALRKSETTELVLRLALREATKTAMYRICATYGNSLSCINLSAEHSRKLSSFLEFKE